MRFDEEDGSFLLAKYVVLYDHKDTNWDNDQHLDLFLKQELQGYYIEGVLEYIEYGEYYDRIGLDISDRLTPLVQYIEYYPDNRYEPYTIGDFLQEIVARGGVRHLFLDGYDEKFIERRFELESILCSDEMVSRVADARIVTVKELEERLNSSDHKAGHFMSQSVYNIVIHTNAGIYDQPELETNPPVKAKIQIVPDLWIEKLNSDEVDIIMAACEPPGFDYSEKRQYTQMYSIVRCVSDDQEWDSDGSIQAIIALSRVIHPTTISYEYSAIVIRDSQENISRVIPGPVSGSGSEAFVSDDDKRNWLTETEINELKNLFNAYQRKSLIHPVSTCLWYYEYCSWQKYIDIRWTLISTALESIVHTGRYRSTKQFTVRIPKMAETVGMIIQEQQAEQFYDLRSSLVHCGLGDLTIDNKVLYCLMEELLRQVIKKSIIDPEFSAFLADNDRIQSTWPLE